MAICTFFGHRRIYEPIDNELMLAITDMIVKNNVKRFYVGNHGDFDKHVLLCLKKLKLLFPDIEYFVVLAYMPTSSKREMYVDRENTVIPEGIEDTIPKFAIIKRNNWMIDRSDYVITYVSHSGGAARFKELSKKKGKRVVDRKDIDI